MLFSVLWVAAGIIFLAFAFVIAFGAPFLPTLKNHVPKALDLIDLKPGQTLLELGSGDGRVLIAAAERGLIAIGYELNPILVLYSRLRTRRYGNQVRVVWGDFWGQKLPPADGIFVFLLNSYMQKLDNKIMNEMRPGRLAASGSAPVPREAQLRLVSFAFKIPGRKTSKEKDGLYLYSFGN